MKDKKDPNTTVLTARIPKELHRRVKSKLSGQGRTFQDLIREAVVGVDSGGIGTTSKKSNDSSETLVYNSEIVIDAVEKIAEMGKSMAEVAEKLRAAIKEIPPSVASPPKQPSIEDRAAEVADKTRAIARNAEAIKRLKETSGGSGDAGDSKLSGTGT